MTGKRSSNFNILQFKVKSGIESLKKKTSPSNGVGGQFVGDAEVDPWFNPEHD